jgi:hypothetical protein
MNPESQQQMKASDSMPNAASSMDGGQQNAHKKKVLQQLMGNLLGKPGRSFHELSNGIKQAIGTYKNFSKEWDTLNGSAADAGIGGVVSGAAKSGAGSSGIQKILQGIQQKKAMPEQTQATPQAHMVVPPSPQPAPQVQPQQTINPNSPTRGIPPVGQMPANQMPEIAGPPQQSSFNRPAPVNHLGIHGF